MNQVTPSWWHTLPGVLTAFAGVVTAIAGLVAILHQAGVLPRSATPESVALSQPADPAPEPARQTAPQTETGASALVDASPRAVIRDPDGYTNLRAGPGSDAAVKARILEGEVFTVLASDGDWWVVKTSGGATGFVHRSRVAVLP